MGGLSQQRGIQASASVRAWVLVWGMHAEETMGSACQAVGMDRVYMALLTIIS